MTKVKKKRKAEKGQDGWLGNLLRFEIVVLLFALIGFYYVLSFSPIRMPKEPIVSPRVSLAPLPPAVELQKVVPSQAVKPQSVETAVLDPSPSAESVPARTLPAPAPASSVLNQVVEVGSYVLQSDLQRFRSQLEALGFAVKTEIRKRLTPMSRVFLGPYPSLQKAKKMIAVARGMGDKPFLQRWDAGYVVVVGSFYLEASVVAWEKMYHVAGLDPMVQKESLQMSHTFLLIDGPGVVRNPEEVLARVQTAGFPRAFLRTTSQTSAK